MKMTSAEAIRKLEFLEKEIVSLRHALEEGLVVSTEHEATAAFLEKCQGWEDGRDTKEIIAEIYGTRSSSDRTDVLFGE